MKARELTENTWLLTNDLNQHISLVFKRENIFISTHSAESYDNLEQIAKEFSEKLIISKNFKEETTIDVLGFPIKHSKAFDITAEPYPTYSTTEGSKVRFAAGWWVVPFESGFRSGMSPKTTTLTADSSGPFKTRFDANVTLNNLAKRKEINV